MLKALDISLHTTLLQYNWIREEVGLPLPGLTTLRKWMSDLELRPDDWDVQMTLLAKMMSPLKDRDRCCILMFDEMDLLGLATYDVTGDQVLGPFKKVQVYFAGGLFLPWKMPVMYSFDSAVESDTLKHLIAAMERAGAHVMAIVSDMGGSNQGLWSQLGISHDGSTHFPNPVDGNR